MTHPWHGLSHFSSAHYPGFVTVSVRKTRIALSPRKKWVFKKKILWAALQFQNGTSFIEFGQCALPHQHLLLFITSLVLEPRGSLQIRIKPRQVLFGVVWPTHQLCSLTYIGLSKHPAVLVQNGWKRTVVWQSKITWNGRYVGQTTPNKTL